MTNAEHERLIVLIQECSDVIRIATKCIQHGYSSKHPDNRAVTDMDNREMLFQELKDVAAVHYAMDMCGDVKPLLYGETPSERWYQKMKWLKHQGRGR